MTQNVSNVQGWAKPKLVELGPLSLVSANLTPVTSQCNAKGECKS